MIEIGENLSNTLMVVAYVSMMAFIMWLFFRN